MSNTSEKGLASICYFSTFFAPILLPLVVWIVAHKPVSTHAKKALIYHIVPWLLIGTSVSFFIISLSGSTLIFHLMVAILTGLSSVYFYIYNLYCGVKVLLYNEL